MAIKNKSLSDVSNKSCVMGHVRTGTLYSTKFSCRSLSKFYFSVGTVASLIIPACRHLYLNPYEQRTAAPPFKSPQKQSKPSCRSSLSAHCWFQSAGLSQPTALYTRDKSYRARDRLNYRPISLTSVQYKIVEHITYTHLVNFLENINFCSTTQHRFSKHLCETQPAFLINDLDPYLYFSFSTN